MFRMPKGGDYFKGFVHVEDAVGSMISVLENNSFGESFIVCEYSGVFGGVQYWAKLGTNRGNG